MKFFYIILFLSMLSVSNHVESLEITEDPNYIYTIRNWSEILDKQQRILVNHFADLLQEKLRTLGASHQWTLDIEKTLLGDPKRFSDIIFDMQSLASNCAACQRMRLADFVPTGFIIGVGVNGSGSYVVGMGGSALLTLIVVPQQVEQFDKITGEVTTYYNVSWSIGGIGQGNVGIGESAQMAFHGGIGLIWGDMPEASELTGPGVGMMATISQIQGLGVNAALVFNTNTHHFNLVSMITYDVGTQIGGSVSASAFFFMDFKQIISFISARTGFVGFGNEFIKAVDLKKM